MFYRFSPIVLYSQGQSLGIMPDMCSSENAQMLHSLSTSVWGVPFTHNKQWAWGECLVECNFNNMICHFFERVKELDMKIWKGIFHCLLKHWTSYLDINSRVWILAQVSRCLCVGIIAQVSRHWSNVWVQVQVSGHLDISLVIHMLVSMSQYWTRCLDIGQVDGILSRPPDFGPCVWVSRYWSVYRDVSSDVWIFGQVLILRHVSGYWSGCPDINRFFSCPICPPNSTFRHVAKSAQGPLDLYYTVMFTCINPLFTRL